MARPVVWMTIPAAIGLLALSGHSAGAAETSATEPAATTIRLGPFAATVPATWQPFAGDKLAELRRQFESQAKEIYKQYSGTTDPTSAVEVVALHAGGGSAFVGVVLRIPPQYDLMGQLERDAPAKAKWGIEHGYIKSASPITRITRPGYRGFYLRTQGASGLDDFVGGILREGHEQQLLQVMLMGADGDLAKPAVFEELLRSITWTDEAQRDESAVDQDRKGEAHE